MIDDIRQELARLDARDIRIRLDEDFEPQAGQLVHVRYSEAEWRMLPEHFLSLLKELPNQAGPDQVHRAIETHAQAVWHGPATEDDRDNPL